MKAMIFAAGRGERMRPLTDILPKPLFEVHGHPLIVWHILALVRAGITEIIINHCHLGHMIEKTLGNGQTFGAKIVYSPEETALETAGAVALARRRGLLDNTPFISISADIYCPQFDFKHMTHGFEGKKRPEHKLSSDKQDVAWLYLVKNPPHHLVGDFALHHFSIANIGQPRYTYAGISLLRPEIFNEILDETPIKLAAILRKYIDQKQVGGEIYHGIWVDVGSIQRWEALKVYSPSP